MRMLMRKVGNESGSRDSLLGNLGGFQTLPGQRQRSHLFFPNLKIEPQIEEGPEDHVSGNAGLDVEQK